MSQTCDTIHAHLKLHQSLEMSSHAVVRSSCGCLALTTPTTPLRPYHQAGGGADAAHDWRLLACIWEFSETPKNPNRPFMAIASLIDTDCLLLAWQMRHSLIPLQVLGRWRREDTARPGRQLGSALVHPRDRLVHISSNTDMCDSDQPGRQCVTGCRFAQRCLIGRKEVVHGHDAC